ncbi:MAG TPA: hypothetical protein VK961_02650 [Chthoniobacter sp.]|nr:hypothetical protein [Chthoniobacter sp.]
MSAEGDENLDNDGAADLLSDIARELTQRILELLVHPRGHEYDDEEICELFVRIEMLFALHDRQMLSSAPEPQELRTLIESYFARWEAYHRKNSHEPPAARRASMIETFRQLLRISIEKSEQPISWVRVELDPATMSEEERAHHEAMLRILE